jgi:hypothetical protein
MNDEQLLICEMAAECERLISDSDFGDASLPDALQRRHIRLMCANVKEHAHDWPSSKLHRWIGFIQGALLANGLLELDGLKSMFDKVKIAYGGLDDDLIDHLNPDSPYELDIGGQG